ncbi:MAG: fluoride efflux transporter CrcB [Clostridia bacterium]|nr:fluoride efflux transporter CrcB [Clostridia bacterium]
MLACLFVGAGGFLGSVLRYLIGLIPTPEGGFPYLTLVINVLGSMVIGIIAGLASRAGVLDDNLGLFLKVGFCGGFTTFSTFALETHSFLAKGGAVSALCYAVISVVLCVFAVFFGDYLVRL